MNKNQYDRCHNLTYRTVDPTGLNETTKYLYDNLDRQYQMTRAYGTSDVTTTYSIYDNANRITSSYTGSVTYATTNEYYQTGQQKQVTDANGNTTQYLIDKGGRLIQTTNALGNLTKYAYDLAGNRITVTYYRDTNPINTTYTYYNNNWLKTAGTHPIFNLR